MSEQKQVMGNILMVTQLVGHEFDFTWRVQNQSLLASVCHSVSHTFTMHQDCEKTWNLRACATDGKVSVAVEPESLQEDHPKLSPDSYIGVVDREGELTKLSGLREQSLAFALEHRDGVLTTPQGEVVELDREDTLVVGGRLLVPSCCFQTEVVKQKSAEVAKPSSQLDLIELLEQGFVIA